MFSQNEKISKRQLELLIILNCFSSGVLRLPTMAAKQSGYYGVVSVAIGLFIALVISLLVSRACKNMVGKRLKEVFRFRVIGFILSGVFLLRLLLGAGIELRIFSEIIGIYLLNSTSPAIVRLLMLLVCLYGAFKGVEASGRMAEIFVFIMLIPLLLVLAIGICHIDLNSFVPKGEMRGVLKTGYLTSLLFSGLELGLLGAFALNDSSNIERSFLKSTAFVGIIYMLIEISGVGVFSTKGLMNMRLPLIELMDVVDIPASIIERQNAFMLSFWIITVFFIICCSLCFAKNLFLTQKHKRSWIGLIAFALVIYLASFLPSNLDGAIKLQWVISLFFGSVTLIIIPILICIKGAEK